MRLTRREQAVVDELKHGTRNKLIAHRLGISEATVKVHLRNVTRKLRVGNRTHIALWAHTQDNRTD